ncbi:MAG: phage major tail tube protein [Desulfotalea sp.]
MAGSNIPEKLIAFKAYKDGTDLIGIVDVEITGGEPMSETLSGAGIAGEIESQSLGLTKPITVKLKFRQRTKQSVMLASPKSHMLELRASKQSRTVGGEYATSPERIVVQGTPKTSPFTGKFETGKTLDQDLELSVDYIKVELDGEVAVEIDKINFIYSIYGKDMLASVRDDLGM